MSLALVTGASGFVGGHLTEALLARGMRVRCLVRPTSRLDHLPLDRVEIAYGAVSEPPALAEAMREVEAVFHAAGITRARDLGTYLRVNAEGCALVARAAARAGVRRGVLVSSQAAGGPSLPGRPRTEEDPDAPDGAYGESKRRGEELLRAEAGGVAWTIVRPPAVYGPRDAAFLVLARLARRGWVPSVGRVPQPVRVIHARDLAEGIIAAGASERAAGRTYYLAHPRVTSWEEMGRLMAARLGRTARALRVPRAVVPWVGQALRALTSLSGRENPLPPDRLRGLIAPAWVVSTERAATELGFQARIDLEEGLAETVDWYAGRGLL